MILITGATGGLGYELARCYAARKKPLLLVARNESMLKDIMYELKDNYNVKVEFYACDLSDSHDVDRLITYIKQKSYIIERVINNAATATSEYSSALDVQQQVDMINVNVMALVKLTDFALKTEDDVKVVNITSLISRVPMPKLNIYAASKVFVLNYSKGLTAELKKQKSKQQVSTVVLGAIRTEFAEKSDIKGDFVYKYLALEPEYVANKIVNEVESGSSNIVPGFVTKFAYILFKVLPHQLVLPFITRGIR